ncbi:MAG: hypothetical protein EXS00_07825 [Phycisphaerales bacterium]|nr:hypothetical protein [Phycisphaerales bacterium]
MKGLSAGINLTFAVPAKWGEAMSAVTEEWECGIGDMGTPVMDGEEARVEASPSLEEAGADWAAGTCR